MRLERKSDYRKKTYIFYFLVIIKLHFQKRVFK